MSPQPSLFAAPREVLLDDATGEIVYHPQLLDADEAAQLFDDVRGKVAWKSERREMYGREVDVPRLLASYRLDEKRLPAALATIAQKVSAVVPAPFNAVGLNLYRDGHDSVAPHNDHLYEIAEQQPIALVSLGATRRMVIRAKEPPRRVLKVDLQPGSLLVMSYATQLHYDHGIPKTPDIVGERISLAFRVRSRSDSQRWGK
jgi:alkylated DNA repair dioxygenase AlkB